MFDPMMMKNFDVLSVLEFLNESRKIYKEPGISHFGREVLHAPRASFVVILKETSDFYINNRTEVMAFHACSFYQIGR